MFDTFKPYVSAAERRRRAARHVKKLGKKGRALAPVEIEGRAIAKTFWGKAWCDNLERYGDFANRLPRGRTYVRRGAVLDLRIDAGAIAALVSGSDLYDVEVKIATLPEKRWNALVTDCAGRIDSLVELLQGRFSQPVMQRMCERESGLFPAPKEIAFECSCPDWARMCKHVAAVLYGVGARLDERPELLFSLRAVNQQDLLTTAGKVVRAPARKPRREKVLAEADLSTMFGIDVASAEPRSTKKKPSKRVRSGA
jgi:uncharacterized Zn finger protein